MLRDILINAFESEGVMLTNADKFEVNVDQFVRKFKEAWLYLNEVAHPIAYESFSGSLYILLYKNLSVTNASVNEIVSLLKIHSKLRIGKNSQQVSFFSDDEYTQYISNIVVSIIQSEANLSNAIDIDDFEKFVDAIVALSGDALENTVVMNVYFSSVLIHVPRSIALDVRRLVAESGYIHSAGNAVYARNVDKAIIGDLETRLGKFLKGFSDKPVFITPYADEFFSPYDVKSPVSIRNGLSGVKLQLRKHHIEGRPLLDYLATLPQRFPVQVPLGLEDYGKERAASKEEDYPGGPTETKSTIWFVVDYALQSPILDRPNRSEAHLYLFVYAQAFLNDNQFILFKERKPGWYASITLPHTLSISLVNILRGARDQPGGNSPKKVFLDPFFGTGTTLYDAALRMKGAVVVGFDRERLARRVAEDNAMFFTRSVDDLQNILEAVDRARSFLELPRTYRELKSAVRDADLKRVSEQLPDEEQVKLALQAIITAVVEPGGVAQIERTIQNCLVDGMPEQLWQLLDDRTDFRLRLLILFLWRSLLLGTFSIRNNADNIRIVALNEFNKVGGEIGHIIRSLRGKRVADCDLFVEREGLYSHSLVVDCEKAVNVLRPTVINVETMAKMGDPSAWNPGIWVVSVPDSLEALSFMHGKVDCILTDPPYGFNSTEETADVQIDFYSRLVPELVRCLKPRGQACLVLPAFAKNGRQIPFFETHGSVVRQFIVSANRSGKRLVSDVETFPKPKSLFKKPFYWSSASVLERRIVHFSVN